MAKKVARLLLTLAGAAVGVGLVALANRVITFPEGLTLYQRMLPWGLALVFVGSGVLLMRLQNLFIGRPNPFLQWAACKKRPLCLVIFGSCTTFVWRKPSPDVPWCSKSRKISARF